MGIDARMMPGGRCVVARLRLQRPIFRSSTTPFQIDEVTFASVGSDRGKCLRPRALFQLPIFRILDCRDAIAIEARIHLAWEKHRDALTKAQSWLHSLGATGEIEEERSVLKLPLPGDDPLAHARCIAAQTLILPQRGPLSGIRLQRIEDRVLRVDSRITSSADLAQALSIRLRELSRLDERLHEVRVAAARPPTEPLPEPRPRVVSPPGRSPSVLFVGPQIGQQQACLESLQQRGYQVETVSGEREAIAAFDRCSPELVLADVKLGRSEGIDLVGSLRRIPGVEEVPVILIDSHLRPERREVARRIGAAGYLAGSLDSNRIAERLTRIVDSPRRRRFTRYPKHLAVQIRGRSESFTAAIGRGGMFLATDDNLPANSLHECQLALPEPGTCLRVWVEVLYRSPTDAAALPGLGVRFQSFPDCDEAVLIRFLRRLQPKVRSTLF
jgi:two-component system chemotaxis response regulator CheY